MKKPIILILAFMLLVTLTACAAEQPEEFTEPTPAPTEAPAKTSEPEAVPAPAMASSAYYEDMETLIKTSDAILIGETTDVECRKLSNHETRTYADVRVKEVIFGDLQTGDTFTIEQIGGKAEDYDMVIHENGDRIPYMQTDTEYFLFLYSVRQPNGVVKYIPQSWFVGFSKIEDSWVYPERCNNIITAPMPLEDLKEWIAEYTKH